MRVKCFSISGTVFPEWDGRGYQIVGFAWHQGFSDKTPIERANEYKDNLPDFISDVRAEFGKPDLPFVIATTGMADAGPVDTTAPYDDYHPVERAQLWDAGVARPANTLTDDTRGYWETPRCRPLTKATTGTTTPAAISASASVSETRW